MVKKNKKEKVNFASLTIGIILIVLGLGGSAITIPLKSPIIIASIVSLILGAFLALMGGLRKW